MPPIIDSHLTNKKGLRVGSLNVTGINEHDKQSKIITQLKDDLVDIMVLVDTKITESTARESRLPEIQNAHVCSAVDSSRGVLIAARSGLDVVIDNPVIHNDGNRLSVDVSSPLCEKFTLYGIYGPNSDDVPFITDLTDSMIRGADNSLATGDFNIKRDPSLDIKPPRDDNPDRKAAHLNARIDDGVVQDSFRNLFPEKRLTPTCLIRIGDYLGRMPTRADLISP